MAVTELVLLSLNTYAGLPQTYEMVRDATVVNRQIKYRYLSKCFILDVYKGPGHILE